MDSKQIDLIGMVDHIIGYILIAKINGRPFLGQISPAHAKLPPPIDRHHEEASPKVDFIIFSSFFVDN